MRLRERAEEYAGVKFEGMNKLGQPMYSSENYHSLSYRELRMAAFLAGFKACAEMAAEIIQCTALTKGMCNGPTKCMACWQVDEIQKLAEDGHGKEDLPNSKA